MRTSEMARRMISRRIPLVPSPVQPFFGITAYSQVSNTEPLRARRGERRFFAKPSPVVARGNVTATGAEWWGPFR